MTVLAYTSAAPAPLISQSDAVVGQASLPQNIQLYGAGEDTSDPGATFAYLWSIISAPPGSTASLSSSTAQNPLLNGVDVWGNYIVMLVVTSSTGGPSASNPLQAPDTARVGVQVISASAGIQKTALGERNWFVPGYWPVVDKVEQHDQVLASLTSGVQPGGTLTVQAGENLAAGDVVYPSGIASATVLVVSKAPATNAWVADSQLLVMEGAVSSGAQGTARWFGLSLNVPSGSPSVGDFVYVSDTATLSLTAGTNSRVIGQVVQASGGTYHLSVSGQAGSGGGGSATAQVLLTAADGDFPSGVDLSALTAPVQFVDSVGIGNPGDFGLPVALVFDDGSAGAANDALALPFGMKNSAGSIIEAIGIKAVLATATAGSELTELYLVARDPVQGFVDAMRVRTDGLRILDGSGFGSSIDTNGAVLGIFNPNNPGSLALGAVTAIRLATGTAPLYDEGYLELRGGQVTSNTNDAYLSESRIERRKDVQTTDATPTVIDSFNMGAATGLYLVTATTTVSGMDAGAAEYLFAQRVARFAYDGVSFTQIGPTYTPVLDDTTGGTLAVAFNGNVNSLEVKVTGDAATTIEWTAWTQFLITKIG